MLKEKILRYLGIEKLEKRILKSFSIVKGEIDFTKNSLIALSQKVLTLESNKIDKELLKKVNREIAHYAECRPISFPRFTSNQGELIRLIDMYYLSQYRDGDTDALGQKKTFYNIVSLPVDVAAKELDIDTKHIRVYPEEWASNYGCILLKAELEQWMKLGYFGRELDKYSFLLSKYGHLI